VPAVREWIGTLLPAANPSDVEAGSPRLKPAWKRWPPTPQPPGTSPPPATATSPTSASRSTPTAPPSTHWACRPPPAGSPWIGGTGVPPPGRAIAVPNIASETTGFEIGSAGAGDQSSRPTINTTGRLHPAGPLEIISQTSSASLATMLAASSAMRTISQRRVRLTLASPRRGGAAL